MEIAVWLARAEPGALRRSIGDNDVDGKVPPHLTAAGFKDIGITSVGDRRSLRVGLESGPLAPWRAHELHAIFMLVVCLDAPCARGASWVQINKSDANDADALAQIVRTGWYREVEVKGIEGHLVRAALGVRKQLVGIRTEMIKQIRGLMKIFGLMLPRGAGIESISASASRIAVDDRALAGRKSAKSPIRTRLGRSP